MSNPHFLHLVLWIFLPQSLATFSQTKFPNFDLQFSLAPLLPHHICLLSNLLTYPASIRPPLMMSLHSYLVFLTLLVILIQSLPHSSNNANLFFFPQAQISSTHLCPLESFLTNLKTVRYILFSKIQPWQRKPNYRTISHLSNQTYRKTCSNPIHLSSHWKQYLELLPVCLHWIVEDLVCWIWTSLGAGVGSNPVLCIITNVCYVVNKLSN